MSTGAIALAEIGDKTQLLALLLAARFRRPVPIILGILCATLLNHSLAGAVGVWMTMHVDERVLRWILAVSFFAMAAWTLVPDKIDSEKSETTPKLGVFAATLIAFFLAEMGDKTQLATVAMAAHYSQAVLVVIGTTLGMLIADVPAVLVGDRLTSRLPMKPIRFVAAALFALLGILTLAV